MREESAERQIRFIADDFGASEPINEAILEAHLDGALHGACLMTGQPCTRHAVALAEAHPSLEIGWHLHLCDSAPTTVERWPWGASPTRAGFAIAASPAARKLVRREVANQWRMLEETGLKITTVNTHHHLHWHPFVRRTLVTLLEASPSFDGWLRWGAPSFFDSDRAPLGYALVESLLQAPGRQTMHIRRSDTLWGLDRTFRMDPDEITAVLESLPSGLHEFMFHPRPGAADPDTRCLIALRHALPRESPNKSPLAHD